MRDLLLAVDLSGSMETKDFKNAAGQTVDRLSAVKEVLNDFLTKREGDRVGLIFFGSAPFVQAPFTEDLKVCRQLLDEAQVKMAGPQTAFGDALGLAITVFDRSTVPERVLIALTDGNDTASKVPPAKAAEIAKDKGIVIHTVSVGDPKAAGEDGARCRCAESRGDDDRRHLRARRRSRATRVDLRTDRQAGDAQGRDDHASPSPRRVLVAAGRRLWRVVGAAGAATAPPSSSCSSLVLESARQ